jgi:hypothetical protein
MLIRASLVAALLVAGTAAQALPLDQFNVPADNKPKPDSSDGLFNHSVPDRWDNSSKQDSGNDLGKIHFSMSSSQDNYPAPRSSYGDAKTPMSEFYQPVPAAAPDPLLDPNH